MRKTSLQMPPQGAEASGPFAYLIGYQAATRLMFTQVLEKLGFTCRAFGTTDRLCAELQAYTPPSGSVVLIDTDRPSCEVLVAIREIRARIPDLPGILTAAGASLPIVREAFIAGARDLLIKPISSQSLADAVRRLEPTATATKRIDHLSRRERQIFLGLLQGLSNKEIARRLELSVRTIEDYRANLMAKLGVQSLAALLRIGFQLRLQVEESRTDQGAAQSAGEAVATVEKPRG